MIPGKPENSVPGDSTATILVVDDSTENLTVLGEQLRSHYRVRVANSGEKALKAAASAPRPDLILLDVMMPGMDGHEVLRRLAAGERDAPGASRLRSAARLDELLALDDLDAWKTFVGGEALLERALGPRAGLIKSAIGDFDYTAAREGLKDALKGLEPGP